MPSTYSSDTTEPGFSISLSDICLTVADASMPIWHGKYHNGTLSIYSAQVTGNVLPNSDTFVGVYIDENHRDEQFVFYATYEKSTEINYIVNHLQSMLYKHYQEHVAHRRLAASFVAGPSTLQ